MGPNPFLLNGTIEFQTICVPPFGGRREIFMCTSLRVTLDGAGKKRLLFGRNMDIDVIIFSETSKNAPVSFGNFNK